MGGNKDRDGEISSPGKKKQPHPSKHPPPPHHRPGVARGGGHQQRGLALGVERVDPATGVKVEEGAVVDQSGRVDHVGSGVGGGRRIGGESRRLWVGG